MTSANTAQADSDDLRWVLDSLSTGVLVLDQDLRLVFMNSAAEMLFAMSFRHARGLGFQELARSDNGFIEALQHSLDNGYAFAERELTLTPMTDHGITVNCTVTPLSRANGASHSSELLIELQHMDRQLRINREEQLLAQHQTSRALIRNLAHEIKNPLGGLRGAAQLLEREFSDDSLKEYTSIIIGEADRLRNLVDRMLGPTQLPVYRPLNIHEILERVRSLVLAETDDELRIHQDYDPSLPELEGDVEQLIQALLNIIRNAVQALDGRGSITLRSRIQRQQTIGQKRHKLMVKLDVIDNGPGIPTALREHIFYPMISGRSDGTGLGLSIAQVLISQHGGLIEFESRPGETVFTVLLPLENENYGE